MASVMMATGLGTVPAWSNIVTARMPKSVRGPSVIGSTWSNCSSDARNKPSFEPK